MTARSILLLPGLLLVTFLQGQDPDTGSGRWQFRSNFGLGFPLTTLKDGLVTDQLIEYDDQYRYWQFLSVNYFLDQKIGLSLTIQGQSFTDADIRGTRMLAVLNERFGEDYFIITGPFQYYDSPDINTNVYVGLVYRVFFNRISISPKLEIGATSFYNSRLNVYLKEKNRNNYLQLEYDTAPDRAVRDHFTIMTGLVVAYDLSKRVSLDLNTQLSAFRTRFDYRESFRNTFTELTEVNTFRYDKFIGTFSIGLGIGLKLGRVK